jgi:type VI secretion system protein ImpG
VSEDLLRYYDRELSHIRRAAGEFARAHPDLAPALGLDAAAASDPYVERLIEAVAFLNARTRLKIEDDFPQLTQGLLGIIAPHYVRPIPSMSIARLALDPTQAGLADGYLVPRESSIETEEVAGEPCRYRTCSDVRVVPIRVSGATIGPSSAAPPGTADERAPSVLRLRLETFKRELPFSKLDLTSLPFYLDGEPRHANALYELLLERITRSVVLTDPDRGKMRRPPVRFEAIGFSDDQAVLPFPRRSFRGFRLLTEYFAMPERFRFVSLAGLSPAALAEAGPVIELVFSLDHRPEDLERVIDPSMFALGCTPIVNLFEYRCDPFRLTQTRSTYRVVPDVRRPESIEIYSINEVTATSGAGQTSTLLPIYSASHRVDAQTPLYWHAERTTEIAGAHGAEERDEVDLTFVDLEFNERSEADQTVIVSATCTNRALPRRLPFSAGRPRLRLSGGGPLAPITMALPPSPPRRPPASRGRAWRLVSHLALGRLSIVEGADAAAELRELLTLYDSVATPDRLARIAGIIEVNTRRRTTRVGAGEESSLCRGTDVEIRFDPRRFADNGMYLFATVLERVLAMSCAVNSFSRLSAWSTEQEEPVATWPPRAGEVALL